MPQPEQPPTVSGALWSRHSYCVAHIAVTLTSLHGPRISLDLAGAVFLAAGWLPMLFVLTGTFIALLRVLAGCWLQCQFDGLPPPLLDGPSVSGGASVDNDAVPVRLRQELQFHLAIRMLQMVHAGRRGLPGALAHG
jgi:hypothetical protein